MEIQLTTKLGQHRNLPRFWTEGLKLQKAGIIPGHKYSTNFDHQARELIFSFDKDDGDFVVKSRSRNGKTLPIVDLRTEELHELFNDNEILHVIVKNNEFIVRSHHLHDAKIRRETNLKRKVKHNIPLDFVSLFHGSGVLDKSLHAGFKKAGISSSIQMAVEQDIDYFDNSIERNVELFTQKSLLLNLPIQLINPQTLTESDAVIAGIPCTASCNQGRAKKNNEKPEADENAGALFFYFLQIISAVNPSLILIENVTNYARDASMMVIRTVLRSFGYKIAERNFDGNEFGALEARKRFVCFSYSEGLNLDSTLENVVSLEAKPEKVEDVLEDIDDDSVLWREFNYLHEKEKKDIAKGNGFLQQLYTGDESKIGVIGRGYQKARSSEPRIVHSNRPELSRLLTLKEHCAIKNVPYELINGCSLTKGHEMLGQSVIYTVFTAIGFKIASDLKTQYCTDEIKMVA